VSGGPWSPAEIRRSRAAPVGFVLGYASLIMFSLTGSFMAELSRTAVRGTGQASATTQAAASARCFPLWWASWRRGRH